MYNFITLSVILLTNFYTIKKDNKTCNISIYFKFLSYTFVIELIIFFLDTTKTYIELRNIHIHFTQIFNGERT